MPTHVPTLRSQVGYPSGKPSKASLAAGETHSVPPAPVLEPVPTGDLANISLIKFGDQANREQAASLRHRAVTIRGRGHRAPTNSLAKSGEASIFFNDQPLTTIRTGAITDRLPWHVRLRYDSKPCRANESLW
jgi:hypothetical protein